MATEKMRNPTISVLGDDPPRTHRINANSFQQNALLTVNGWQYAAFYQKKDDDGNSSVCHPTLARRPLRQGSEEKAGAWEYLVFNDYEQTADDGHNTISIGACTGDGTIHVSYDHHCDPLRYRSSVLGLATRPQDFTWDKSQFSETSNTLPGLSSSNEMTEVSYPRFVSADEDMMLTYRIGQAGSGSDVLYRYSATDHAYTFLGTLLTGEGNSPYINGMDHRAGRLHVSWTYRKFLAYDGALDPTSTAHKTQAGPNGPENNYDLCYMYSDDKGSVWRDSHGNTIANLAIDATAAAAPLNNTVRPTTAGITVFDIPTNSGILNQEGQAAAPDGGFHVLNRERLDGVQTWVLYSRHPSGLWQRNPINGFRPTATGSRGSVSADRRSNLYVVLPGNNADSSLSVVRAGAEAEGCRGFETLWAREGFEGEPLVDRERLEEGGVLSVFTRTARDAEGKRKVAVIDFDLGGCMVSMT